MKRIRKSYELERNRLCANSDAASLTEKRKGIKNGKRKFPPSKKAPGLVLNKGTTLQKEREAVISD